MFECSFCHNESKQRLTKNLCHACYEYFYKNSYKLYIKSKYGRIDFVQDKESNQYNYLICHECGKAFMKLQQHIYNQHKMTKNEYCDKWGLNHNIRLTNENYHLKMRNYAYKYNMSEQLKSTGIDTRFKLGQKHNRRKAKKIQNF